MKVREFSIKFLVHLFIIFFYIKRTDFSDDYHLCVISFRESKYFYS